jgi:hypothetical protein
MKYFSSHPLAKVISSTTFALFFISILQIKPSLAQSTQQNSNPTSTIEGDANNVFQTPNQNSNINDINVPNIYPLQHPINTPVNTENDLGINMSVGVNTLDASNVTVYLGIIYQPGRTDSHLVRMQYLKKQTEILDTQKQIAEAQLQLIQKQIQEAEIKLKKLQDNPAPQNQNLPPTEPQINQ